MSFHTITMMVQWAVTADKETMSILNELGKLSIIDRKKDIRVETYVKNMYEKWRHGTKIEKLATLGWKEYDSVCLFCEMIDTLPALLEQYREEIKKYGTPPQLKDEDIELYETEITNQRNNILKN